MPLVGLLALAFVACGPEYVDPIRARARTERRRLRRMAYQANVLRTLANGCSFQPNALGCKTTDPKCTSGSCRSGDHFVRTRPAQGLWLLGQPYRFVGTVSWGIAWGSNCRVTRMPAQETALERVFDDLRRLEGDGAEGLGVSELRRDVGQRLCDLPSGWSQRQARRCTPDFRAREPVRTGLHVRAAPQRLVVRLRLRSPYGDYALSLEAYARGLVHHFRNEATILAWRSSTRDAPATSTP